MSLPSGIDDQKPKRLLERFLKLGEAVVPVATIHDLTVHHNSDGSYVSFECRFARGPTSKEEADQFAAEILETQK